MNKQLAYKANNRDKDWYNDFYKTEQKNFTSWYRFALDELINEIKREDRLLEIGCGQAKGLRWLRDRGCIKEENIYAIDQSINAVNFSKTKLPNAHIHCGDAYHLKFSDNFFNQILLMEVIEHLDYPNPALQEIYRVLKPGGKLFLSFPNYLNFPWFVVRVLAEKLNKPNWIVLQPMDKIYTTINIINFCKKNGLRYKKCIGSNYFPPIIWKYEPKILTKIFNKSHLSYLSFHPILIFKK